MTRSRSRGLWWVVALVLVAGAAWGVTSLGGGGPDKNRSVEGATVQRGPLLISVVERGNIEAADAVTLKSEVEGQTTVLWLIEEGTHVEPGELLCELDASSLEDRRVQQEIRVQNAEATFVKAQQNHAIQVSQNESDIARARQDLDFAELDREKFVDGDLPQELQSKEEAILLADEELTRAEQDLVWSERLAAKGFLEQTQLDADRLAKTRAEVKLNQAKRAKDLYESFEVPKLRAELEAAVEEAQRELERVQLQAKARLADFEANLRTSEATLEVERDELEKIVSQIEKSRIVAPVAGMVVYARERSRWGGGEPMQEGATVRERQDIITIPSSEGFVAEASLHESVLEKVSTGMECRVTVDALEETFPGVVAFKAVLPDQQSWFANPDLRVYRTEVRVLSQDRRIRPGMSCSIEILVDELADTLYVPVQAVFLDAGGTVCLVSGGERVEKRPVEVGPNNGKWVAVESGLREGETVLLAKPPGIELRPFEGSRESPGRADADGGPWRGEGGDRPDGEGHDGRDAAAGQRDDPGGGRRSGPGEGPRGSGGGDGPGRQPGTTGASGAADASDAGGGGEATRPADAR